ncbi:MAG: hypothetical protein SGI77_09190 [Pirellulaceae bacterium]|nr:hypothetical protein [Pirellulaceae bacterium]
MNWPQSELLLEKNAAMIPGGLVSLNRKAEPVIAFAKGKGSKLWDIDGHEYIDYHADFSPYILGHNDDDQIAAVTQSMAEDLSNWGSGPTREEGELARLFCKPFRTRRKFSFSIRVLKPLRKPFESRELRPAEVISSRYRAATTGITTWSPRI